LAQLLKNDKYHSGENSLEGITKMESKEPNDELTAELLGSWWALSLDALIESAGPERTLAAFRPHIINSSHAGFLFICKRMGWKTDNIEDIGRSLALMHTFFGRGVDRSLARDDQECLIRFSSCPFSQGPRESCMAICYYALIGVGELIGPGYAVDMPKMMKNGDPVCVKWVRRVDATPSSDPSEWRDVEYGLQTLSKEERDWFFRAYMGEMWMLAIRAFNDLYGKEGTLKALAPRMRADGMSLGTRFSHNNKGLGPEEAVKMVMSSLRQKVADRDDGGGLEVTECPFSSQPEVCSLLEAFLDGLCDALRPGSGYCITQKMTDGAASCMSKVR
jgi:hypothetical protein